MNVLSACFLSLCAWGLVAGEAVTPPTPPKAGTPPAAKNAHDPYLGVKVDETSFDPNGGLAVEQVVAGSTAEDMDIRVGDRLLTFNDKKLASQKDLKEALAAIKVHDPVTITVTRPGTEGPLTLTGTMSEKISHESIYDLLQKARQKVNDLNTKVANQKPKQLSLPEILDRLKDIEIALPGALEEFKRLYPNGRLAFSLHIDITSDRDAKSPVTINNRIEASPAAEKPAENKKK